jgi:hypothetical protein
VKNLPSARVIDSSNYVFDQNYGVVAAANSINQRWMSRQNNALQSSSRVCMFMVVGTGLFTFRLSWAVFGTPLAVDNVEIEIWRSQLSGIAAQTGVKQTIPAGVVGASGQVFGDLTMAFGDGVCVGLKQTGTEAQAAWNLDANLKVIL